MAVKQLMQATQGAAAWTLKAGYHAKGTRRITGSVCGIEQVKVGRPQGQHAPHGGHFQTLIECLIGDHSGKTLTKAQASAAIHCSDAAHDHDKDNV